MGDENALNFKVWSKRENTDKLIASVSKFTKVDLSVKDISVSHRIDSLGSLTAIRDLLSWHDSA